MNMKMLAAFAAMAMLTTTPLASADRAEMDNANGVLDTTIGEGFETVGKASCDLDSVNRLIDNVINPPISPGYEICPRVDGGCTVSEVVGTTVKASGWHVFFYAEVSVSTSVKVTTTIDCNGSFEIDTLHYGGLGLRTGISTLQNGAKASAEGATVALTVAEADKQGSSGGCTYHSPLGACRETTKTGTWKSQQVVHGRLIATSGNLVVCGNMDLRNLDTVATLANLATVSGIDASTAGSGSTASTALICDSIPMPKVPTDSANDAANEQADNVLEADGLPGLSDEDDGSGLGVGDESPAPGDDDDGGALDRLPTPAFLGAVALRDPHTPTTLGWDDPVLAHLAQGADLAP